MRGSTKSRTLPGPDAPVPFAKAINTITWSVRYSSKQPPWAECTTTTRLPTTRGVPRPGQLRKVHTKLCHQHLCCLHATLLGRASFVENVGAWRAGGWTCREAQQLAIDLRGHAPASLHPVLVSAMHMHAAAASGARECSMLSVTSLGQSGDARLLPHSHASHTVAQHTDASLSELQLERLPHHSEQSFGNAFRHFARVHNPQPQRCDVAARVHGDGGQWLRCWPHSERNVSATLQKEFETSMHITPSVGLVTPGKSTHTWVEAPAIDRHIKIHAELGSHRLEQP